MAFYCQGRDPGERGISLEGGGCSSPVLWIEQFLFLKKEKTNFAETISHHGRTPPAWGVEVAIDGLEEMEVIKC